MDIFYTRNQAQKIQNFSRHFLEPFNFREIVLYQTSKVALIVRGKSLCGLFINLTENNTMTIRDELVKVNSSKRFILLTVKQKPKCSLFMLILWRALWQQILFHTVFHEDVYTCFIYTTNLQSNSYVPICNNCKKLFRLQQRGRGHYLFKVYRKYNKLSKN